jgi:hypothetical protein
MVNGRSPREVFQHHAEALGAEKLEGIVADYSDDAIFITPEGVLRGKDGIRQAFTKLLADVPQAKWDLEGHRNSDWPRDQGLYFEPVASSCRAVPGETHRETRPQESPIFPNIDGPYQSPWLISGWQGGMNRHGVGGDRSGERFALCSKCSAGRQAAASRKVYQARPRVWRGRTEPQGLAGQAVDRNRCTLQRLSQKPPVMSSK